MARPPSKCSWVRARSVRLPVFRSSAPPANQGASLVRTRSVEAHPLADRAGDLLAVAERHRHRVVRVAGDDEHRREDAAAGTRELDEVPSRDPEPLRRRRREVSGVLPGELRHRIRELLQPGVLEEAAVPDLVVRREAGLDPARRGGSFPSAAPTAPRSAAMLRLPGALGQHSRREPLVPRAIVRIGCARPVRVDRVRRGGGPGERQRRGGRAGAGAPALAHGRRAPVALPHERSQEIDLRRALVERRDERLHDRDGAVARAQIAPRLERVARREPPARRAHRLVVPEREDHRVLHLPERLAQLEIGGRGVERVPGGHHERVDLAGRELARELAQRVGPAGRAAPARASAPSCRRCRAPRSSPPRARARRAAGGRRRGRAISAGAGEVLRDRPGGLRPLALGARAERASPASPRRRAPPRPRARTWRPRARACGAGGRPCRPSRRTAARPRRAGSSDRPRGARRTRGRGAGARPRPRGSPSPATGSRPPSRRRRSRRAGARTRSPPRRAARPPPWPTTRRSGPWGSARARGGAARRASASSSARQGT